MRPRGQTRGLAPALIAAVALSSCGSGAAPPTIPKGHVPGLTRHTGLPAGHAPGAKVRVTLPALTLFVTVQKVIDPLADSGAKPPAGTTPVGVRITVRNAGPATYDSSATSDFALLTPRGPAVPVFAPSGSCQTYVQDFMNELGPGDARTGCISYAVPRARPPTSVRFTPYGGHAGRAVSWQIPGR